MTQIILVGIVAGIAAALLFAAPLGGLNVAYPLFILAGVPIAIAGFGWTLLGGLVAAATAALVISLTISPLSALPFLLVFSAPLLWAVRLAHLHRTVETAGQDIHVEWYPAGRILLHLAIAVAAAIIVIGIFSGYDPDVIAGLLTDSAKDWLGSGQAPAGASVVNEEAVHLYVATIPYTTAILGLATLVFDLWLGAWIARATGRFRRPRTPLWSVSLPRPLVAIFVVALVACFFPLPLGNIAAVVVGATGTAAVMAGLSVLHAMTLGSTGRPLILVAAYAALFILGFPALLFALLGIADSFLDFRARRANATPPASP